MCQYHCQTEYHGISTSKNVIWNEVKIAAYVEAVGGWTMKVATLVVYTKPLSINQWGEPIEVWSVPGFILPIYPRFSDKLKEQLLFLAAAHGGYGGIDAEGLPLWHPLPMAPMLWGHRVQTVYLYVDRPLGEAAGPDLFARFRKFRRRPWWTVSGNAENR